MKSVGCCPENVDTQLGVGRPCSSCPETALIEFGLELACWTRPAEDLGVRVVAARCVSRSFSFFTVSTGCIVIGSRPVQYMHVAMSIGAGMKSCTWRGL